MVRKRGKGEHIIRMTGEREDMVGKRRRRVDYKDNRREVGHGRKERTRSTI